MMEAIDVIDTAVKVGLGAMISGVSTYWVTKLNHASDREKDKSKRTHETLISITEKIERYLDCMTRCIARVDGIIKHGIPAGTIPDDILNEYRKVDSELVEARKERSSAYSRLRLIGEMEAANCVRELTKFESKFRNPILFDHQLPSQEELIALSVEFTAIREKAFKALNTAYNNA
jgi:hypothetical protein